VRTGVSMLGGGIDVMRGLINWSALMLFHWWLMGRRDVWAIKQEAQLSLSVLCQLKSCVFVWIFVFIHACMYSGPSYPPQISLPLTLMGD